MPHIKCEKFNIPYRNIKKIKREPSLSIIIPTKNKFDYLKNCLDSILTVSNYSNYTIHIADTGSDKEILLKIKEYTKKYDFIKLHEFDYYNFAKINNEVVKTIDSDLLLFCNNDIKLINDSITTLVDVYTRNKNVGTIGCRLHYEDGSIQHCGISVQVYNKKIFYVHIGVNQDFNILKSPDTFKSFGSTGAFLLTPRSVFENLKGFNEEYEVCFEDVEYNARCVNSGLVNYTSTVACNFHYESISRGKSIKKSDVQRVTKYVTTTDCRRLMVIK